jgi:hypothetical protein
MSDTRFHQGVVDELCRDMTSHEVVHVPPRDILQVEELSTTWRCFPRDMTMLMHHIVCVVNLIDTLRVLNFHYARLKHAVYFNFSIYLNHKQMQLHHSQLLQ